MISSLYTCLSMAFGTSCSWSFAADFNPIQLAESDHFVGTENRVIPRSQSDDLLLVFRSVQERVSMRNGIGRKVFMMHRVPTFPSLSSLSVSMPEDYQSLKDSVSNVVESPFGNTLGPSMTQSLESAQ
jgi:hypothetical protein